jgi:hypothetical protein
MSMSNTPDRETVLKNLKSVSLTANDTSQTSQYELNFSEREWKPKLEIIQVVRGDHCPQGQNLCFERVKEK